MGHLEVDCPDPPGSQAHLVSNKLFSQRTPRGCGGGRTWELKSKERAANLLWQRQRPGAGPRSRLVPCCSAESVRKDETELGFQKGIRLVQGTQASLSRSESKSLGWKTKGSLGSHALQLAVGTCIFLKHPEYIPVWSTRPIPSFPPAAIPMGLPQGCLNSPCVLLDSCCSQLFPIDLTAREFNKFHNMGDMINILKNIAKVFISFELKCLWPFPHLDTKRWVRVAILSKQRGKSYSVSDICKRILFALFFTVIQ